MAIAHVATGSAAGGVNGWTSGSANMTGVNLLVIAQSSYVVNSEPTPTDSSSNVYTGLTLKSGSFWRTRLWYKENPTVTSSMTGSGSTTNSFSAGGIMGFSGVAASSAFDQQNGASSISAMSLASGSITPSEDNELIVTMGSEGDTGTLSVDSSITLATQVNYAGGSNVGMGCGYKIQTSAAAISATWSKTGSATEMQSVIASFKAAAAAGTRPVKFAGRWGGFAGGSGGFAA